MHALTNWIVIVNANIAIDALYFIVSPGPKNTKDLLLTNWSDYHDRRVRPKNGQYARWLEIPESGARI
jgi:hypothetical protein